MGSSDLSALVMSEFNVISGKIKTGVEILSLFIVPRRLFDLLRRWRRTQVLLDKTTSG